MIALAFASPLLWLIVVLAIVGSLAFVFGALCGRATGWHEGYEAASSKPGEDVPEGVSPFVRDQAALRSVEEWTSHLPKP